jgi:3-oxoacyl-[acyl-carrier protein] reductase
MDLQLTDKRVLATGSSAGIGRAIAGRLAEEGASVVSSVRLIRHFGPRMREIGWRRIINISSGAAWQPFANMADYTATKAAILNLTVSLAKEFAGQGVTVNTVSPGIIATESTEAYFRKVAVDRGWPQEWPEIEQRVIATFLPNSAGRLGRPSDVANVVALIASPLSGYINGANYRVDGGSTTAIN